jgi:hypothetical protein
MTAVPDVRRILQLTAVVLLVLVTSAIGLAGSAASPSETVMITMRAKAGADADVVRVLADHWSTARRLGLVRAQPHVTLRGTEEGGRAYFVDIFTWVDGTTPDHAPSDIQAIWTRMNALVEPRGAHPGLDITPFDLMPTTAEGSGPHRQRR